MGVLMPDSDARPRVWEHARGSLRLHEPVVMAVLNATPDSFHDGGALSSGASIDPQRVRASAQAAIDAGAGLLDVGGESTRPGADPVDAQEECARVVPAIRAIADLGVPISIDTRRARVAELALEAGAAIVNDVSGLADPDMAAVVARHGAGLAIGHMRGQPKTMQARIVFADLLEDIASELEAAIGQAHEAGVSLGQVVVDPGVGFGKTAEQSAALVASSAWFEARLGVPVMIGASRKSFIGAIVPSEPAQRLPGSLAAAVIAARRGAALIRVHDVAQTQQALAVAAAIDAAWAQTHRGAP